MDLKQIQYFLAIAETGSFSAAADRVVPLPVVPLQADSGAGKRAGLSTLRSHQTQDRSDRSGGDLSQACRAAQRSGIRPCWPIWPTTAATPSFSIVAIPVIAQYGITAYIAQLKSAYPNLQFTLEEREASAILPALNSHQYDLAFVRDNYLDRDHYACLEVSTDQFEVIVSNQHRYATRQSLALAELSDENFIMFDKGTVVHELAVEACRSAGFEPRIFYASLRVESVIGLVAQNIGVALMMERIFDYFQHPDVVAIPLQERIDSRIVIAYLKHKKLSHSAKIFVDFMRKTLAADGK